MANKILKLLIGMDKQISNVERAQTEFLCETVLPVAKVASCKGNLSDIYRCLTNSSEYKDMALHLMIFLLESVSCPRYDELLPFIKSRITARIPKLALRILLMGIANNLGEDAEDFIRFAASELQLNPQIFFTDDANHCVGLLELFKRALKQRVISTNDLSKLKDWLKSIENNDEDVWEIFEKYDETLHLPSELPGEREPAHARLRSLSGPESVHSGTPPQGESGSMMQQGISVGSQQFREENIHTASSQFPRAHPDHVTRSSASSSTAVIPGREDTPFLNPNQQPITHDVPMKPRAEAQDSGSETDNEGHKQSEKQYSVEEEEPTAGQSEHVYIRSQSDTGANSESSHRFRDSLQSAYANLPETVGYSLPGVEHLNPTLYEEVSSPENGQSQSPVSLEYVFSSESHKAARKVLLVAEDEFGGSVVLSRAAQQWSKGKVLANTPFVLYVPMQKLAGKPKFDLDDILGIYSDSFQRNDNVREHIAQNDGEDVAFLFDGLKDCSVSAVDDIIHRTKFSKASVYISCQPSVAAQLKTPSTTVVKVGHLSEENVCNFLCSCFEDDPTKAKEILQYCESLPTAKSLSRIPMHLAIVASMVGKAHLPDTETKLVQLIVLYALRFAYARGIAQPPGSIELHSFDDLPAKEKQVFDNVCKLAFDLLLENRHHFTQQDLPNCSSDCKVSSLLQSLLTTSQMLTEKGQPTTVYRFIDPSIQGYLSALYLSCKVPPEQWYQCVVDHGKELLSNTLNFFCGIVGEKAESNDNFLRAFKMIVGKDYDIPLNKIGILPFRCAFEAGSAKACTSLIRTTRGEVDIQGGSEILTPSDCSTIGYVINRTTEPVTALDLTSCHFQSGCMESLVAQLEKPLHAVRKFDYSGTGKPVNSETIKHLCSLLEKLPSVMNLSLCSINMQHESQEKLLDGISKMEKLQSLSLTRNSFTAAVGGKCGETVHMLKQLEKLDFSYNEIGDEGLESMLPGLKMAHSLKELSLQECGLNSGRLILEIHQVKGLTCLNLRDNSLGDRGIEDMADVEDSRLETLNLTNNRITKTGASQLVLYVQRSAHLKKLNLSMNNIPEDYVGIFKIIRPDLTVSF